MDLHYFSKRDDSEKYFYNPLEQWILCYKNGNGFIDYDDDSLEKMRKLVCNEMKNNSEISYLGIIHPFGNEIKEIKILWEAYCQTGKYFDDKVKSLFDKMDNLFGKK